MKTSLLTLGLLSLSPAALAQSSVQLAPAKAPARQALAPAPAPAPTVDVRDLELNAGTLTLDDFDLGALGLTGGGSTALGNPTGTLSGPGGKGSPIGGAETVHPLGRTDSVLSDLDELALFTPSYGAPSGTALIREDFGGFQLVVPGTQLPPSTTGQVLDATTGNIDDDGGDEVVLLQQLAGSSVVRVMRIDRTTGGAYQWTLIAELAGDTFSASDGRIALGDFDGDLRDEIAVTLSDLPMGSGGQRSCLYVLDDVEEGAGEMLFFSRPENHVALWPEAADLTGDGVDELVLVLEGSTSGSDGLWVRAYHCGPGNDVFPAAQPQAGFVALHDVSSTVGGKLAIGNHDDDRAEEVIYVTMLDSSSPHSPTTPNQVRLRPFEYSAGSWTTSGPSLTYTSTSTGSSLRGNAWDVAAVDRFARGRHEVAILRGSGNLKVDFFDFQDGVWASTTPNTLDLGYPAAASSGLALAAGDGDGDGAEDLYFAGMMGSASSRPLVYGNVVGSTPSLYSLQNYTVAGESHAPVLAPGDLDADGFRVRYTGVQELSVSDPIPLVLLAAAPTKAGIQQNHDASSTSYSVSSGTSQAVGVSVGVAASVSAGVDFDLFGGLVGGSAKATIETALTVTGSDSNQTTFVQGFSGGADADVIVFQGPLFRSSEYEILSAPDPSLVGTRFRIDVPLAVNTYKWTVPFYNDRVRDHYRIGSSLLPHTAGDPDTYLNATQAQALADTYVSWKHPVQTAVGQGTGANSLAIELENEVTFETQLELSLALEAEFKIGGLTVGAGLTLTAGTMYSISTSNATAYEGVVGDIGAADYATWQYDFGLLVYQAGRLANSLNLPIGWTTGAYPLTVVTYWTNPTGSGY